MLRRQQVLMFLAQYWLHIVISVGVFYYYSRYLTMPLTEDEISAYGIPVLKLIYNDFSSLLPWRYLPEDFFGHPPLNTIFFGLAIKIFPQKIETFRIASLFVSLVGLFTYYEIGKVLKNRNFGILLIISWLSYYYFWENSHHIYADNLFHTIYVLFVLSYLNDSKKGLIIFGLGMILVRETAAIPLFSFWLMEALKFRNKTKNRFALFSALLLSQIAWFVFLYLKNGNFTPVYHNDEFYFDLSFVSKTFFFILKNISLKNFWYLTLIFIFYGPVKKTFKEQWGLLLIPTFLILGLTTITASNSRYQVIGASSWLIFLAINFSNRKTELPGYARILGLLILIYIFNWNLNLGLKVANKTEWFQKTTYSCSRRVVDLNLQGTVRIGGWPIQEMVPQYHLLNEFRWTPNKKPTKYVFIDHKFQDRSDYDYIVMLLFFQNEENTAYFKNIYQSPDHEIILGDDFKSGCIVLKKK